MTGIALAVLRCYPAAWRRRYAAEVEELIRGRPVGLSAVLDLLCCAIDAHLHPQLRPALRIVSLAAPVTAPARGATAMAAYGPVQGAAAAVQGIEAAIQGNADVATGGAFGSGIKGQPAADRGSRNRRAAIGIGSGSFAAGDGGEKTDWQNCGGAGRSSPRKR